MASILLISVTVRQGELSVGKNFVSQIMKIKHKKFVNNMHKN